MLGNDNKNLNAENAKPFTTSVGVSERLQVQLFSGIVVAIVIEMTEVLECVNISCYVKTVQSGCYQHVYFLGVSYGLRRWRTTKLATRFARGSQIAFGANEPRMRIFVVLQEVRCQVYDFLWNNF